MNTQIVAMPTRPKRTNQNIGQSVNLFTNHFVLTLPQQLNKVYIYSVGIFDEENNRLPDDDTRRIKSIMSKVNLQSMFKSYYVCGLNVWASSKSNSDKEFPVEKYRVEIKFATESTVQDLSTKERTCLQFRQFLNVVARKHLCNLGYAQMDSKGLYFKPNQRSPVQGYALDVIQGFKVSVDMYDSLNILIDFSSRIISKESALDVIRAIKNQEQIKAELVGNSLLAHYSSQMYRISGIEFKMTPQSKLETQDLGKITYAEYYRKRYNIVIKDNAQPLLVGYRKKGRSCYLIPELMFLTGLTDKEKANGKLMQQVAIGTKLEPHQRQQRIFGLARELRNEFKKEEYDIAPVKDVKGIRLNPPIITAGKNKIVQLDNKSNFILKDQVLKGIELKQGKWAIVYHPAEKRDDNDIDDIVDALQQCGKRLGIMVGKPFFIVLDNSNPKTWNNMLDQEIKKGDIQFVLSVSYDKNSGVYQSIKKILINQSGIPNQHMILQKYLNAKNQQQLITKLLLQINGKLGGPIIQVEVPKGISNRTMLVGIDVYHKTLNNQKSCAGFVATTDNNFTQYYSSTIVQKKGQEMVDEIAQQMRQALNQYQTINKYLPDTIIVYRDGVGENQYQNIIINEINQIKQCFGQGYQPGLAVILVNKRISNRFFQGKSYEDCDNVMNGTLVANTIVKPGFNFYLIAQCVASGQGTATPTHYTVVENTTQLAEEMFWQLTYFQCYNYANWTGPVRVPGVCQYAHKLAYFVGETFQDKIHHKLQNTLSFL